MFNALFSFKDRHAGESAARRLDAAGLRDSSVGIHAHSAAAEPTMSEFVTGGFVRNFESLWSGIFEWGGSPHETAAFEKTVSGGGTVLSVNSGTVEDRELIDRLMLEAQADDRTDWRDSRQSN